MKETRKFPLDKVSSLKIEFDGYKKCFFITTIFVILFTDPFDPIQLSQKAFGTSFIWEKY